MHSQTTLLSSIPERSIRDSYLAALLIVCIIIKWLYSIVFVFVFVVIFLSFSVIQSYRSMSMKNFFECQIAVNVLINFSHQIRSLLIVNFDADIIFLQETCSTRDIENIWRKQWKVEMFFSHGSNHSRGVLVLMKDNLDFKAFYLGRFSRSLHFSRGLYSGIALLPLKHLRSK